MKRRVLVPLLTLFALGAALPSTALARDIEREPGDYAADLARWHFVHKRDRQAIQAVAREFPTVRKAFSDRGVSVTPQERLATAKDEDWWLTADALGTTLAAVLASEGRYAITKSAAKQAGQRQQDILVTARGMVEHLRANMDDDFNESVWSAFARNVQGRATTSLQSGDYDDVVSGLLRAHPEMARLFDTPDANAFRTEFEAQHERIRYNTLPLISAVLRSKGEVALGQMSKQRIDAEANLRWAVMAAGASGFDSPALRADALEAQPDKRDEYVAFVLETARARGFHSSWGWKHVERVSRELLNDATQEIQSNETWEKEEKPSRIQPKNRCG